MHKNYIDFAGRKLIGLIFCVIAMVVTALGSLGLCAAKVLDPSFATNITIAVCGGIGTLYGLFVAGNSSEHLFKNKYGEGRSDGPLPSQVPVAPPFVTPPDLQDPGPG